MVETKEYALGAAYILYGDPTIADGAGMNDFGQVPSAIVRVSQSKSRARDVGGIPQAAGAFDRGVRGQAEIQFYDVQAAALGALLSNAEVDDGGVNFSTDYKRMDDVGTLVIIPAGHEGDALASKGVWWIPAADIEGQIEFNYNDTEGNEANQPWTATFEALLRVTDQDDTAIPGNKRVIFRNTPPSGWSLPAKYTGG